MRLDWVMRKLETRKQAIEAGVCNLCGDKADKFRDGLSKAEYAISATCQACQDGVFEEDPYVEGSGNDTDTCDD